MRSDARRNRALILAAAEEAFARDGLGVPVDEIARRAGVGAGTLYRHFPTKEALFEAVLIDHMTQISVEARELGERDDPAEALFEFIGRLGRESASKRDLIEALSGVGFDIHEAAAAQKADIERVFEELLKRAQDAGQIRPDVTLADLFGLVMGTCSMTSTGAAPGMSECSQARMLAVICDGLRVS